MALLGTALASPPLPRCAVCGPGWLITWQTIEAELHKRLGVNLARAVQLLDVVGGSFMLTTQNLPRSRHGDPLEKASGKRWSWDRTSLDSQRQGRSGDRVLGFEPSLVHRFQRY